MNKIIELKSVTKRFGGITALNKASLNVRTGEVVGLIGDNGAGKSTLINTVCGIINLIMVILQLIILILKNNTEKQDH